MKTINAINGKDDYIRVKIMKLAPHIELNIMTSLLIVRHASRGFVPACTQPSIWGNVISEYEEKGTYEQTAWDTIISAKNGEYIRTIIHALHLLTPRFPALVLQMLRELIFDLNPDERILREMIDLLSKISLEDDFLAQVYEYRLSREPWSAPSFSGNFYTPSDIAGLLFGLLDIKNGSVYDPCCGSGTLLCQAKQFAHLRLYGQATDRLSYQVCQVNSFLHNLSVNLGNEPANTLTKDLYLYQKFDYILTNIPFNSSHWDDNTYGDERWQYGLPPNSNANFAWLQHIICHLAENGRAAVLLPNSSLTSQVRSERDIRKGILESGFVEVIITLPSKLFSNTKIPCCVWILNKRRTSRSTTLLVDAKDLKFKGDKTTTFEETAVLKSLIIKHRNGALNGNTNWYAVVSTNEIAQKKYILSPNLYTKTSAIPLEPVRQNKSRFIALIDVLCLQLSNMPLLSYVHQWKYMQKAEHWRKAALLDLYHASGGLAKKKEFFGRGTEMVDVKTAIHHAFLPDHLTAHVEVNEEEKLKYQVKAGDILLNRTSESVEQLACCCVVPVDCPVVYGSYIKCLRPVKNEVPDPFYMAGYLRSAIYRQEVKRVSTVYTTRASMNMGRLSEIFVYYPDGVTQKRLGETLFSIFQFRNECKDKVLNGLLGEFEQLLIEQFITYPILCLQGREENNK